MAPAAVCNDDCECAGELARFAAQLQIAPAAIRRQLRNAHAFDDLAGRKHCLKDTGRKLGAFDRPPPGRAANHYFGIKGRQNGGPFGGGVRQRQAAADRAAVTDRAIGERRRDPRH